MFEAAKLRPVVIDESLTGLDTLKLAREMGYTGAALKACKGQSQTLLLAAALQKYKMFLCVQDLTCPGAALVHSVGIASHVPGVSGLEANAREYVPAANRGLGEEVPRHLRSQGRMDAHDRPRRPRPVHGVKSRPVTYRIIENGSGRRIVLVMLETISASL